MTPGPSALDELTRKQDALTRTRRRILPFFLLILVFWLAYLTYNLITEYQKHGSRIFTFETTRIGENESAIADLSERLASIEATLENISSRATADTNLVAKVDDDAANRIAAALLADSRLRAEIVKSISDAPTEGLLSEHSFRASIAATEDRIQKLGLALNRLDPIYDAIDLKNREQTLAVPLIRKDVDSISKSVEELEARVDEDRKAIQAELAVETSRIYDLGKWFLGLILVACILPLLEPLFKRSSENPNVKDQSTGGEHREDEG